MTKDALFYRNVSQSYQITPIALEYLLVFLTSCFLFCFFVFGRWLVFYWCVYHRPHGYHIIGPVQQ